jgi:hypothetical protein
MLGGSVRRRRAERLFGERGCTALEQAGVLAGAGGGDARAPHRPPAANARLNDASGLELLTGSWFQPVAGREFDLVVCNPPFVVSPDSALVYRDSDDSGDGVSRDVVAAAARTSRRAAAPRSCATGSGAATRSPRRRWDGWPRPAATRSSCATAWTTRSRTRRAAPHGSRRRRRAPHDRPAPQRRPQRDPLHDAGGEGRAEGAEGGGFGGVFVGRCHGARLAERGLRSIPCEVAAGVRTLHLGGAGSRRPRATMDDMNPVRLSLLTAALAGAVLAPAAAAQGAPTTLASELAPTRVAAWDGTAMWSRFDPATKTYTLVKSVDGGAPVAVGVAPRSDAPFDIDLGTNRGGRTFAVYTRDGDIYRLNVATGAETKLEKLSSPTLDERDPTIQRGEIAFIRRSGGRDELRIGNTTSGSDGSRLIVRKRSILNAELGIRHIAYVESVPSEFREVRVRVRNIGTRADRLVYRARSGGANAADVTRPAYIARAEGFVWARTNTGSGTGNRLVRYTLRGSKLTYAQGSPRYNSTAWAGNPVGVVAASSIDNSETPGACSDVGVSYCQVIATGPLAYDLRP